MVNPKKDLQKIAAYLVRIGAAIFLREFGLMHNL